MTMNQYKKKVPTPRSESYMTLPLGTKIVVIGGANARKVGYIVGETSCHYHLVFIEGSAGDVWRQNVRELSKETSSAIQSEEAEIALANEKADI